MGLSITFLPQLQVESLGKSDQKICRSIPYKGSQYDLSQLKLPFIQVLIETIKNLIRSKFLLESVNLSRSMIKVTVL